MNSAFFISDTSGDLLRKSDCAVVRKQYAYTSREIDTLAQVKATLRAGARTFPGCYPLFLITKDSAALCFDCARKEFRQIVWDFQNKASTGWRVCGCDVNWEDPNLVCDHCSKPIASAYGE